MNPPPSKTASTFYRPTWVDISTRAFGDNVRQLKAVAGSPVALLSVLKADGYGHGADVLAPVALANGASAIGVSSLEEGIALRVGGIRETIVILGGLYPLENFAVALEYNLVPTVASLEAAQQLLKTATGLGKRAVFHLKVDTGMGRLGVSLLGAKSVLLWLKEQSGYELAGIYSHFSCADSDPAFTQEQLRQFQSLRELAITLGFSKTKFHMANSAAMLRYPESRMDMVRPGLATYGISSVALPDGCLLSPVLSWHTKVVFLKRVPAGTPISYGATFRSARESEIATLPVGYADGVPRRVSNKAQVLVNGRKCPVVGRVTMDHIMVDVTDVPVSIGDTVTLIGQQKQAEITAVDWADWADTVAYEIFCGISKRVPRIVS